MRKGIGSVWLAAVLALALLLPSDRCLAVKQDVLDAREGVVRVVSFPYAGGNQIFKGSGFAVGEAGEPVQYFVTNHHVVDERDGGVYLVMDSWADQDSVYPVEVVYESESPDLAILYSPTPVTERVALPLLSAETLEVTQDVYALGFPGVSDNMEDDQNLPSTIEDMTVTQGAVTRQQMMNDGALCLQTDAVWHGGNSGGPLVTENGCVVGINTFTALNPEDQTRAEGSHYSIYVDYIIELLDYNDLPYIQGAAPGAAGGEEPETEEEPETTEEPETEEEPETTEEPETEEEPETTEEPETEEEPETTARPEAEEEEGFGDRINWTVAAIGAAVVVMFLAGVLSYRSRRKRDQAGRSGAQGAEAPQPPYPPRNPSPPPGYEAGGRMAAGGMAAGPGAAAGPKPAAGPEAAAAWSVAIMGISGPLAGRRVEIRDLVRIGRDPARCQLLFPEGTPGVSALHCELRFQGGRLFLADLGSSYGTFRNGVRVVPGQPVELHTGDRFYLGDPGNLFQVG